MGRLAKKQVTENMTASILAAKLRDNGAKKFGKDTVQSTKAFFDNIYGVPITNNLPLQYLLGTNVIALGRGLSLVGPFGSTKSSLGWYISKLFMEAGGLCVFIDTEHKTNTDQARSLVQNDKFFEDQFVPVKADSLDKLLSMLMYQCEEYVKMVPERNIPMILFGDSLNAVTSDEAFDKRMEDGSPANTTGMRNAGQIQQDMQILIPKFVAPNPITLLLTNHQKEAVNTGPAMPYAAKVKSDPGGRHKDFVYTWKLELSKRSIVKSVYGETPVISMKLLKSSLGIAHTTPVEVPYVTTYDEAGKEFIHYDWDTALVNLLLGDGISQTLLKNVLDLKKMGANKFSSDRLNLFEVDAPTMGAAIHHDPQLTEELQTQILRIKRKKVFGVDVKSSLEIGDNGVVDEPNDNGSEPVDSAEISGDTSP